MKRFITPIVMSVVGLTALLLNAAMPHTAQAQDNSDTGQALEIAPPLVSLRADPGETINTKIQLRNVATSNLVVTNQINDFAAAGEDGTPQVLLDEDENTEPSPYSLKDWINPLKRLVLKPNQIEALPVTIQVPANASPGSYYGVIRFSAVPPNLEGTGVSLSASLGSLVFVRVNGDAKESLQIEEFFASKEGSKGSLFESTPVNFVARLNNTGNVHLRPTGRIIVSDMFGNEVAGVNMNLAKRNVLPSSIRKFEEQLNESQLGGKRLFGRYTAELTVTYGENEDNQRQITENITFWVVPWKLIVAAIAVLIGGFFGIRYAIRRYNQKIIEKARRR